MTEARIVLTTVDSVERAREMARALVEQRLAACVTAVERVHSTYRWRGAVETAEETLLVVKTTAQQVPALRRAIAAMHPYELPEVLELPVEGGSGEYLAWLGGAVGPEME